MIFLPLYLSIELVLVHRALSEVLEVPSDLSHCHVILSGDVVAFLYELHTIDDEGGRGGHGQSKLDQITSYVRIQRKRYIKLLSLHLRLNKNPKSGMKCSVGSS